MTSRSGQEPPLHLNQGWVYQDRITPQQAGLTVLDYYTRHYPHSSREEWRERLQMGQIRLDRQISTPETLLRSGQQLSYHRPPWQEPPVPLNFEVLHADADVLVVAKPAGLPVLPGGGFLEHTLLWQLQRQYPQETPVPIHRLGRGTSGLLLLARSPRAKSSLSQQLRQRQVLKRYRALAAGVLLEPSFTITTPIGKLPHPQLGYIYAAAPTGKPARSDCRVLEIRDATSLLEVTIRTGRPHQIRIHLAAVGHPLVGDPLYASGGVPLRASDSSDAAKEAVPGDCGYHLHATELAFSHPGTGEWFEICCKPPAELG